MNIITLPLGPLETNCYVVFENAPGACVLVDPGAQAQHSRLPERTRSDAGLILLTHAHFDHTGALRELRRSIRTCRFTSARRTPTRR